MTSTTAFLQDNHSQPIGRSNTAFLKGLACGACLMTFVIASLQNVHVSMPESNLKPISLVMRHVEKPGVADAAFGASGSLRLRSVESYRVLRPKFEAMERAARQSGGNIAYTWGQSLLDPLTFNIQELWTSYDAWFAHNSLPEVAVWYNELQKQGGLQDGGMSNVILFNASGAASLCEREPYKGCFGRLR